MSVCNSVQTISQKCCTCMYVSCPPGNGWIHKISTYQPLYHHQTPVCAWPNATRSHKHLLQKLATSIFLSFAFSTQSKMQNTANLNLLTLFYCYNFSLWGNSHFQHYCYTWSTPLKIWKQMQEGSEDVSLTDTYTGHAPPSHFCYRNTKILKTSSVFIIS